MEDWKIVQIRDMSVGRVIRKAIDVQIPEGHISDTVLLEKAEGIIKLVQEKINAVVIFFWRPGQEIGREAALAAVDWAPYGRWQDAHTVSTGDISHHELRLAFNNT